ncbi:MAG TPA: hypothetical protein VJ875_26900 [Pyrinomonadaceae bacterium]|nr:hypothetical protein [Pyrinomonadaceae bacterium]
MFLRVTLYLFLVAMGFSSVYAQTTEDKAQVTIILAGGDSLLVDEVSESADGYWYKRGNITTFLDRVRVVRIELPKPPEEPEKTTHKWRLADATKVEEFFVSKFKRPLPLSAFGQSELHTRWGLDHRNGMDVGVHPDSVEGRALIEFLRAESIPFLVFRGPVPGVATGPHIHIGNRSPRTYGR